MRPVLAILVGTILLISAGCHYAYPEPEERDPQKFPTSFSEGPSPVSMPFLIAEGLGQMAGIPFTILMLPAAPFIEDEGHHEGEVFRVEKGISRRHACLSAPSMALGYGSGLTAASLPWISTRFFWGWFFHPYVEIDWESTAVLVPAGAEPKPVAPDVSYEMKRRGVAVEKKDSEK